MNKAADALARLLDAEQAGSAAASSAQTLLRDSRAFDMTPARRAEFAAPEALATAVGAGWLLGPVGGVLLGVAQGILGKRAQQNALDEFSQSSKVLDATDDIFSDEVARLSAGELEPQDVDQLSSLLAQKDTALSLAKVPGLSEKGAQMLADAYSRLNDFSIAQEEQRIERETAQAAAARDLEAGTLATYNAMLTQYRADSGMYKQVMYKSSTALRMLESGSPADIKAAVNMIQTTLDPAGVVRPEDEAALAAIGGYGDRLRAWLENAGTGTLTPNVARELSDMLYALRSSATDYQLAVDDDYQSQGLTNGFTGLQLQDFQTGQVIPRIGPDNVNIPTLPKEDLANIMKGIGNMALENTQEDAEDIGNRLFGGIRAIVEEERRKWNEAKKR